MRIARLGDPAYFAQFPQCRSTHQHHMNWVYESNQDTSPYVQEQYTQSQSNYIPKHIMGMAWSPISSLLAPSQHVGGSIALTCPHSTNGRIGDSGAMGKIIDFDRPVPTLVGWSLQHIVNAEIHTTTSLFTTQRPTSFDSVGRRSIKNFKSGARARGRDLWKQFQITRFSNLQESGAMVFLSAINRAQLPKL